MTTTEPSTKECIESCNRMLRGERSAVETYDIAIEKFGAERGMAPLSDIRAEHARSVNELEAHVRSMGGEPDTDSGAWGTFATLVQKTASLFGEESAIEALEMGEAKGLNDYRNTLGGDSLAPGARQLYSETLIPRIERHIGALDRFEDLVD